MKNKIIIMLALTIFLLMISFCFAANPKVQIDGKMIDFTDENGNKVEAQLINNRTMVPLRKIFEELDCIIEWDQQTKTVTAKKDAQTIKLTIGNKKAYVTDFYGLNETEITLDSEPVIVDNRTLVPLRFIGESLGADVGWDQANQTAIIISYKDIANIFNSRSAYLYLCAVEANNVIFEKRYYDLADSNYNGTTKIEIEDFNQELEKNINVTISGSSDFVKEVENEGWNSFSYKIAADGSHFTSSNYVFSSMLGAKKNTTFNVDYEENKLSKDKAYSFEQWIKSVSNMDTKSFNINTYKELKKDWEKFANTFLSKSKKLSASDFEYKYINVENIANSRVSSEAINGLLLLNKICFRLNLNYQDLLSDFPDIVYEFSEVDGNKVRIKLTMKNEYKERVEYEVVLHVYNLV